MQGNRGFDHREAQTVGVVAVVADGLPADRTVHRVRESAHVVDALVKLAQAHEFPFVDLTSLDGTPLSVRTDHVREISTAEPKEGRRP